MKDTPNILHLDPDPQMRAIVEKSLGVFGFTIQGTDNPSAAIITLEKGQFDLFILEYLNEKMNGIELLYKIRNEPRLRKTKILFASLWDFSDEEMKILGQEDAALIKKPFPLYELTKVVLSHVLST